MKKRDPNQNFPCYNGSFPSNNNEEERSQTQKTSKPPFFIERN